MFTHIFNEYIAVYVLLVHYSLQVDFTNYELNMAVVSQRYVVDVRIKDVSLFD